ncbi:alpha-mannosidase [Paenibacillus psychroresistens]|uniref:Alpha-mannosidase n=1 Tax=Paenibacillus psychroresistens TaxID=1778678 RepID=A0A6B8RFT9_9BACL|nr:alpha-mannosidase [Paenibacillus psychroresistens]QGQ94445.1 alpha-mannosidase [Paenibacillus psychroresistens]
MFWTVEKLQKRISELSKYRYKDTVELNSWVYKEDQEKRIGAYPPNNLDTDRIVSKGDRWEGRDLYVWLRKSVEIPNAWKDRTIVGLFDFGKTGSGHNSGFESLLFIDGKPYQGVDSNHIEVFLPADLIGKEVDFCFRLWSGLEGWEVPGKLNHVFKEAALAVLDERVDSLYYTSYAVLESAKLLRDDQTERHELLKMLNRIFLMIDWSKPGSDIFYSSLYEAELHLQEELKKLAKIHPVTIHCIGHTHIDVAWLWRLSHTREKSARSFSTVLRLMEKYPEYIFLQTQPQLYEYIKYDYPEIYEQIKQRVKEGRWEVGGAMWLEADCNLTSGESIVRQILYGTRFFQEEFGVSCNYVWLPDVFGYSWALPQILKKSGIDTFMTTKISWNQYNRMPHDTFQWQGIDGSKVLTHFVTTPEIPGSKVWWYTYNGMTDPFAVKGIWDTYRDKTINNELLLSYGYGDGGGGVNRDMLEVRRRLESMPGIPHAVTGRADDYFTQLQETFQNTDQYVHTWDGELYLEYHRGTYTSQAYNKKMNRKLELLYREVEWLQSVACIANGSWTGYETERLKEGWRTIMRNQFHDIIPGSSIPEVYADSRIEYAAAELIGHRNWREAANTLKDQSVKAESEVPNNEPLPFTVFNSSGFERTDLLKVTLKETAEAGDWLDKDGKGLVSQRFGDEWTVRVVGIPSLGAKTVFFQPIEQLILTKKADTPFVLADRVLTTSHYIMEWNEAGQLKRLYDRDTKREVLSEGKNGNVLQVFEDKPLAHEAWDIDLFYQEKMQEIITLTDFELLDNGPLSASMKFVWSYGDSTIEQKLTVYENSRRIDFQTRVDWQESQQLLKVAFPVSIRATEATYDIQFGNVKRPTHWNTSWDYARFESVGHQWVDLSERGYGVSLLNDCKYGHDIKDNIIRLSLIKSPIFPDPLADRGEHLFTYALLPHIGDWVEGRTQQEAWMLNNPLSQIQGDTIIADKSLMRTDAANVMIDAIKKAEDSDALVLRLHEFTGASSALRLESDFLIQSWQECDLMERPCGEISKEPTIDVEIKPYEIKTFLIKVISS